MANYERGVYEPPSDDIRVFDGGEDDIDEEGSRLPLLIVIALLVLAAFGGVVWLAYTQGVQRGRSDAPRIIAAAPGPDKTAPANSNEATPYQGLKIYEQPAPPDDEVADDETAAQQTAAPDLRPQQNVDEGTKPAAQETKVAAQSAPPPKPAVTAAATPEIATAPPRPLMPAAKPAPVMMKPSPPTETAKAPPAVPAIVATTPKPAASTSASAGSIMLQIGSYKSADDANAAWKGYEARHPIAGGYSPDVKQADLGDKGTWYRLRIGPFADKAAANAFCDKLKADGGACFPAAP